MKQIIKSLDIAHIPHKFTPATAKTIVKNEDGDPPNGTYNYSSVIGMIRYLQRRLRPDIIYALRACACFVYSTRRSHKIALENIGQYLMGTIEEVIILIPL